MFVPTIFFHAPRPQKGIDGHYRCRACGLLMKEARFYCPECRKTVDRGIMKGVAVAVLSLIVVVLVFLLFSGSH